MKAKFIKQGNEILFQDKNGEKYDEGSVAELFEMVQHLKALSELAEYYSSERVDGKNFYRKENQNKG